MDDPFTVWYNKEAELWNISCDTCRARGMSAYYGDIMQFRMSHVCYGR